MAEYKVVNATQLDADMESLADSIRAKAGVTEKLAFPAGMKSVVENIQSGITPSGTLEITENGDYDVTEYAGVSVDVAASGGGTVETCNVTVDITAVYDLDAWWGHIIYTDENNVTHLFIDYVDWTTKTYRVKKGSMFGFYLHSDLGLVACDLNTDTLTLIGWMDYSQWGEGLYGYFVYADGSIYASQNFYQ